MLVSMGTPSSTWRHRIVKIDLENRLAECLACGPVALTSRIQRGSARWICPVARREQRGNTRLHRRTYALKKKYGITVDAWDELLMAQAGRCAVCLEPMLDPHVDHDHSDGRIRGLLCSPCNTGLGQFGDDPDRLRRAAHYLTTASRAGGSCATIEG